MCHVLKQSIFFLQGSLFCRGFEQSPNFGAWVLLVPAHETALKHLDNRTDTKQLVLHQTQGVK